MLLLLRTEATVAERYLAQEQLQGQLRAENQVRDEFRIERTRQSKELDELHRRRRSAVEAAHETLMKIREIEQKRNVLAQRIDEEYQISLDDLVASGVSAYRDYIQETLRRTRNDFFLFLHSPLGRGARGEGCRPKRLSRRISSQLS